MLLEIKGLKVKYGGIEVIRGSDLSIERGRSLALVGESGCGKTTLGLAVTKLIPRLKGEIASGSVLFNGRDLLKMDQEELRLLRGRKISYVFQEPFSSLNPVFTVYEQIREAVPDKKDADNLISEALSDVGLEKIIGRNKMYPHELSGGMQQRVMIAMAIISRPELLILDEPTTALDVTVQSQILNLILKLKEKMRLSILFISHDLRVVFRFTDGISVMYAGRIIEEGPKEEILGKTAHPYTIGLINSIPSLRHRKEKFRTIEGSTPVFSDLPKGCKFYPRCKFRVDECLKREPDMEQLSGGHFSRCIKAKDLISDGIIENK